MLDSDTPNHEGKVIAGRYRVERLLGQGGMGSVWAGRHLTLQQLVAIKFIHPKLASSAEALRRFDTEARAAARLKTRHAVAVYDHGVTSAGEPFIVMEYLEGESLEQRLRARGPLSIEEVVSVISQAAKALTAAHEQGILHRDLKPDNIFLARDREAGGAGYVVKLVDFGIAKIVGEELEHGAATTQAGVVLGTPHYMSPEALTASAPVEAAADIWSLGACAFAAACGRVPFEGDAIGDVVLKVCVAPLPVPSRVRPDLPRAFDEWFARACARRPSARFASAVEAERALQGLEQWSQREREAGAYQLTAQTEEALAADGAPLGAARRGLLLAGILIGGSVMLAGLGYYVLMRTRAADAEIARATASARAAIEAQNERTLREADAQFWSRQADAGAPDSSANKPPHKKRR